jgi:LPXTG-motif cell wall-anchored protein
MSRKVRLLSAISAVALLLASCGGGDSSGRTKNSALCYDSQEAKVAAVELALAAFNAAMGGGAPGDSISDTTVPETEDSVVETEDSVVDEAPSDTVLMESSPADGGGYRRPAVRAASSGDTTVPPAGDGGGAVLTPEQQQAQMDLEAAEAQPLCEAEGAESASEVICTATATIDSSVSDDCADGDVRLNWGGSWTLVNTAEDGTETVLTQGTWAVEALSADNPIIIPISYSVSYGGEEENSADGCTATFTSTGVSWDCPNGELFNAAIEDMSNPGVYPLVECSASGSFTVADGQQFWFNFYLVNGDQTFFDGWNTDREQNVQIGFNVPEDTEGVCAGIESEEIDWESLPFSGQADVQITRYSFTVPEEFDGPVLARFESTDDFDVDIDDVQDFESYPCDSECPPYVGYSMWDLAPGEYFIEIEDNSEAVNWVSNVEIVADPFEFPKLPFSYTSDGSKTTYILTLTETETVTLTATAGQTCMSSEDGVEGNGFVDPELDLVGSNGVDESDDDSGRGAGNCSASLIEIELEPGTYTVMVEDDDQEGGSITLGSSVELTEFKSITWDLVSTSASPDTTFEIVVPAGGAWFKANTVINGTRTWVEDLTDPDNWVRLSEEGCGNPDGDVETEDWACMDSYLVLLDSNDEEVISDDDGGMQWSESTSNGIRTTVITNFYASEFSLFLEEGVYTLAVMDCCGPWRGDEPSTHTYEVNFGLGSVVAAEIPKVEVVADENPTIPASVEQVKLPDAQLSVDGSVSTAISDGVNTMVCDTSCIDAMFTSAGIADGTITISAGGDSVTMRKGQKKAMIPIGSNADAINATVVSADGSQTVSLSSNISQIPASVQSAFESKTTSGSTGSGSSMNWLLIAALGLIVIAGAGVAVSRKKKSA